MAVCFAGREEYIKIYVMFILLDIEVPVTVISVGIEFESSINRFRLWLALFVSVHDQFMQFVECNGKLQNNPYITVCANNTAINITWHDVLVVRAGKFKTILKMRNDNHDEYV